MMLWMLWMLLLLGLGREPVRGGGVQQALSGVGGGGQRGGGSRGGQRGRARGVGQQLVAAAVCVQEGLVVLGVCVCVCWLEGAVAELVIMGVCLCVCAVCVGQQLGGAVEARAGQRLVGGRGEGGGRGGGGRAGQQVGGQAGRRAVRGRQGARRLRSRGGGGGGAVCCRYRGRTPGRVGVGG
jgi:hypothetical protein